MTQPTGLLKNHGAKIFPHPVAHSALFDGSGDYLSFTSSTAGNEKTWTFRTCIKLAETDQPENGPALLNVHTDADNRTMLFLEHGRLRFIGRIGGSTFVNISTDALLADPTGWGDLCVRYDSTRTTEADRYAVEWNGVEIPLATGTAVPLNQNSLVNGTHPHYIGRHQFSGELYDGYLADTYLIDGQALPAATWGEPSGVVTGLWIPKDPGTLTYGTNGCHLNYSNAADLGEDSGGNGNDWAVEGSPAQTLDTPTNNHCTLNALDPNAGTLSNGNLTLANGTAKPTLQPESGEWYYEKDGVGISYDAYTSGKFAPDLTAGTYNFGAAAWDDTGPAGSEKPLCSANLPTPAILRSAKVADIVLREGSGTATSIAGLEFRPDFVNIKDRDNIRDWALFDSARTATHCLSTNTAGPDAVDADSLTSFDSDGYGLGESSLVNHSGASFVDLCLKAGVPQGFEIVTYSGNGITGRTISHGLGKAPTLMVIKNISLAAIGWAVYHVALGATEYLTFDAPPAITAPCTFNDTEPTATGFTLGDNSGVNGDGYDYVAYLFTDSDIFRAFSYTGNNSTDGPFVNLGGRPLAIPFLKNSGGSDDWQCTDNKRNPHTPAGLTLRPNESDAEYDYGSRYRYVSAGFKIVDNTGGQVNELDKLYVGLAILESAGKYANAF